MILNQDSGFPHLFRSLSVCVRRLQHVHLVLFLCRSASSGAHWQEI